MSLPILPGSPFEIIGRVFAKPLPTPTSCLLANCSQLMVLSHGNLAAGIASWIIIQILYFSNLLFRISLLCPNLSHLV